MVWPTIQPTQSDKHLKRVDNAESIKSTSVPTSGSIIHQIRIIVYQNNSNIFKMSKIVVGFMTGNSKRCAYT